MKFDNKALANYAAEFLGSFLFGVIIFLSVIVAQGVEAFSIGLGLIVLIYAFSRYTKSHFNPIVTIGSLIARKISLQDAFFYLFVQLVAIFLAFGVGHAVRTAYVDFQVKQNASLSADPETLKDQIEQTYVLQSQYPEGAASLAFVLEALFSYVFVLVILMVTTDERTRNSAGFITGLTLFVIIAISSQISGGAFHPFRTLVAGLFNWKDIIGDKKLFWDGMGYWGVYIVGPFLGSVVAGVTYHVFNLLDKPFTLNTVSHKPLKPANAKSAKK